MEPPSSSGWDVTSFFQTVYADERAVSEGGLLPNNSDAENINQQAQFNHPLCYGISGVSNMGGPRTIKPTVPFLFQALSYTGIFFSCDLYSKQINQGIRKSTRQEIHQRISETAIHF